jgi:hypothetical protein
MTIEIKVHKANKLVCSVCGKEMPGYSVKISFVQDKSVNTTLLAICFICYHELFLKPYYQFP